MCRAVVVHPCHQAGDVVGDEWGGAGLAASLPGDSGAVADQQRGRKQQRVVVQPLQHGHGVGDGFDDDPWVGPLLSLRELAARLVDHALPLAAAQ